MMHKRLVAGMILAAATVPDAAHAQPGKRLTVDITVIGISRRGDTTRVEFVAKNRASSREELFQLSIDAPSPVIAQDVPLPRRSWFGSRAVGERSVAGWDVLDTLVKPGRATPTLAFEAIGLPGIVSSWVIGYADPEVLDTSDVPAKGTPKTMLDEGVKGVAVGVSPYPTLNTPAALIARLDSMTARACAKLGWIASAAACAVLDSHLAKAMTGASAGDHIATTRAMAAYQAALVNGRKPAGPVNDNAFWLLSVNATHIADRLVKTPHR